jgi:hypothetical protein
LSVAEINNVPVIRGTVRLQRVGLWIADLSLDQGAAIEGAVTLSLGDGALELVGTAARSGVFMESAVLRVIGGAGGLTRTVAPKFYRAISVKQILTDILSAGGERLAASSNAAVLARQLDYCQIEAAVGDALAMLCDRLGVLWRALPDGSIWVGLEGWGEVQAPGESIAQDPHASSETWGVEAPTLLPGTVIAGRKVSAVEHQFSDGEVRTVVFYDRDDAGPASEDRQTRALRAIVERVAAPYDFFSEVRAKVVKQNSDGTLELVPQSPRLPGLTRVPIRNGLPGVQVKVVAGAFVLVRFEDGDPGRPAAGLFDPGSLQELTITAGAAGLIRVIAGAGGTVSLDVGAGGAIKLGGDGAALAVALQGDTAGPYPVICKGLVVKGRAA